MFTFKLQAFAISSLLINGNARESARRFEVKFGKPVPDHKTINKVERKTIYFIKRNYLNFTILKIAYINPDHW